MVSRLVEDRTRRGRRTTYAVVAVAAAVVAAVVVLALTGVLGGGPSDEERVADAVAAITPGTVRVGGDGRRRGRERQRLGRTATGSWSPPRTSSTSARR